jgi:hypothetical protein
VSDTGVLIQLLTQLAVSRETTEGKIMENCVANQYWNNIEISGKWKVMKFTMLVLW